MKFNTTTTYTLLAIVALALSTGLGTATTSAQFFSLPEGQGFVEGVSNNGVAAGSFNNPSGEYFMWEIGVGGKVDVGGVPAGTALADRQRSLMTDCLSAARNSIPRLGSMKLHDTMSRLKRGRRWKAWVVLPVRKPVPVGISRAMVYP